MATSKFVVEKYSVNNRIVVIGANRWIKKEFIKQSKDIAGCSFLFGSYKPAPEISDEDTVLVLLSSNHDLKRLQKIINNNASLRARFFIFYLAKPSRSTSQIKTKIIQLLQISHANSKLNIIDTNQKISWQVGQMISEFIYGYSLKLNQEENSRLYKPRYSLSKLLALAYSLLTIPYLIFIYLITAVFGFTFISLLAFNSQNLSVSLTYSKLATGAVDLIAPFVYLPGVNPVLNKAGFPYPVLTSSIYSYHNSIMDLSQTSVSLRNLFIYALSSDNTKKIRPDISQLSAQLSSSSESLAILQSDLKDLYITSPDSNSWTLEVGQKITVLRSFISKLIELSSVYNLYFPDKPMTYLIVFQDNTDIRPTGGLIDSLYLVNMMSGKITQIRSLTALQADSQLVGQVNPPVSFQMATGKSQWLIRDANWDPDFPTTADKISWFITKELNINVDGVVAVNSSLLPGLLKISGPIDFPPPVGKINSDNFYDVYLRYLDQVKYSGQSTFLSDIINHIFIVIQRLDQKQISSLLSLLAQNLESHQILISPTSFTLPELTNTGWTGILAPDHCLSIGPCIKDLLYKVDSSLSYNHADYGIDRTTQMQIKFSDLQVNSSIKITYRNKNLKTPSSNYKDYLRLYLPPDSQIDTVSLNNHPLPSTAYTLVAEHGLSSIAMQIEVSPQEQTEIIITYHRPMPKVFSFRYQLDLPLQPGVTRNNMDVSIDYPPNWTVSAYITPQAPYSPVATVGSLRYNTDNANLTQISLDIYPTK